MIKTVLLSLGSLVFMSCQEGGKTNPQRVQYEKQQDEILALERELKDLRTRVAAVEGDGTVISLVELQDQIKEGKVEVARLDSELKPLQESAKKAERDLANYKAKHRISE